jgi:hypothetical protein
MYKNFGKLDGMLEPSAGSNTNNSGIVRSDTAQSMECPEDLVDVVPSWPNLHSRRFLGHNYPELRFHFPDC